MRVRRLVQLRPLIATMFTHLRRASAGVLLLALGLSALVLLMLASLAMLNAELYGRWSETKAVPLWFQTPSDQRPLIRLVLHRLVPEENAVEASIVLVVRGPLVEEIKKTNARLTAVVRDGSTVDRFEVSHEVSIDSSASRVGMQSTAVQSPRFLMPVFYSVASYPFDEINVRPWLSLQGNVRDLRFDAEIQKTLRGRILSVEIDGGVPLARLNRTVVEQTFVITASLVFLILAVTIAFNLFRSSEGLTSLQELIAVAGFLLAAAGFRELLGVSRVAGTSLLEMVIVGLPLIAVSLGMGVSMYRARRNKRLPTGKT